MKLDKLLIGDIRFQFKYGFYMLYAIFTCLYIIILNIIPTSWVYPMGILLIFSDPSAIGLVFSGAIIQFELTERTFESLKIAPIKPIYYLLSKIISLTLISLIVGVIIGVSLQIINHLAYFILAIVLGSLIFSCAGIIIAFKTKSLNQFFLIIIPIMALVLLPGGLQQFISLHEVVLLHPGISMVEMLNGGESSMVAMFVLIVWLVVVSLLATHIVFHQFRGRKVLVYETNR